MASNQQYHHFLTSAAASKPKAHKLLSALKRKVRERDPDTGQFCPSKSTTPLDPSLTVIPPSPNTKRRIIRERTKASRARNNDHRTSKDGSTLAISIGTQGILRFSTKETQKARPELGNGEGVDVQLHHVVSESVGCSGEPTPCSDVAHIVYSTEADGGSDMDWMAGSSDFPARLEEVVRKEKPEKTTISSNDSRRKYKENAAIAWTELIDGSEGFLMAFLQAESDLHCNGDATAGEGENEQINCCKCGMLPGEYCKAITCVGLEGITTKSFMHCSKCKTLPVQLIRQGLFPASPTSPKTAFTISLLNFYVTMNTVSHTPVQAFTEALVTGMQHRGHIFDKQFPFLQQLQFVIPWYEKTLRKAELNTISLLDLTPASQSFTPISTPPLSNEPNALASTPGLASALLRRRCPNCFGRTNWGGDPNIAPDVIVALDGNFQHRRYKHIRPDQPILTSNDQFNWLTDDEVEQARKHVDECRSKNDRADHSRPSRDIPGHILDECEKSYKASQEKMQDPETSIYDSKGILAVVCRHDIPLFMLDIKSVGEPRYYAIALLQKLGKELPESATIGVMYDIGEQLDRSIGKHNLIPELAPRLSFALALFHAFGHQMACQVVYSPRWKQGFGLTNGEGNERVWALSTDTIGAERVMGPHRRKLLLSKKMDSIACRKRKLYNSFYKRMKERIEKICDKSNALIRSIPTSDNVSWTKERLLQQANIKKNDHLNAKDCSATQLNENIGRLLDAVRSAAGMTKALNQVTRDLEQHDYAQMLLGNEELDGLRQFAKRVISSHEETLKGLDNLSENLGLSSVKIPEDLQLTEHDHQYLKHLIHLQRYKKVLWTTLQAYQDEYGPIREAASRGGSMRRLGTTQLQVSKKAMKSKMANVKSALKKFNTVLEAMEQLRRPEFIPEGLIPRRLEADELLHIEPGNELWDEVFGGTPWIDSWNEQPSSKPIPEYAKSKAVREGIAAALALERAAEEEKRLNAERVNGLNEWIRSLFQVWECSSRHINGPFRHRLDLLLQSVLRSRPRLGDFSPYHPKCPLLHYSPSQLLDILLERHPSNFLYEILDSDTSNLQIPGTHLSVSHHMGNEIAIRDLGASELLELEGDIKDYYENDSVTGLQALDDADEADEREAERAFSSVFHHMTDLALHEDDDTYPGNGTSQNELALPSARRLIQRADGISPSEPIVPYTQFDLPPARLLMNIVDNPGNVSSVDPDRIVGSAINASLCFSSKRIQVGTVTRFYREFEITEDMLKTFDDSRHLDESVVMVCSHLIADTIGKSPLADGISLKRNHYIVLNVRWNSLGIETFLRELKLGRDNGWDKTSQWIAIILLPGTARKYVLIRLNFSTSSFWVYCGTTLSSPDSIYVHRVVGFLQKTYKLIWGLDSLPTFGELNCIRSPHIHRQESPSQSSLWILRDLKYILTALSPDEAGFNAKEMRNWLRQLIVALPEEIQTEVDTITDQHHDPFPALEGPITDLFSLLINTM